MPENAEVVSVAEAKQDVAQPTDAKAEFTGAAKTSDELSGDDLESIAGGGKPHPISPPSWVSGGTGP